MTAAAILITGGSGYVARFLIKHFAASGCQVGCTAHVTDPPPGLPSNVQVFQVDLATGQGLDECLAALTAGGRQLAAVVNCGAISQPSLCEQHPQDAEAVNVPTKLLEALQRWWEGRRQANAAAAAAARAAQQQQQQRGGEEEGSGGSGGATHNSSSHSHDSHHALGLKAGIVKLLSRLSSSGGGGGGSKARRSADGGGGGGSGSSSGGSDNGRGQGQGRSSSHNASNHHATGYWHGHAEGLASEPEEQPPLLVHFSTDQVYSGSRPRWTEDDAPAPVNVYGRTKLAGERAVAAAWPNHAILRSSLVYGPEPPYGPVGRPLFLQWLDGQLAAGTPTEFYTNEWRCPVRVRDVVRVVQTLIFRQGEIEHRLFNMGGPDRLSRADMALAVAQARGYDASLVQAVPAPPAEQRLGGAPSPADISMDSSRLEAELHLPLTPFRTAIQHIFSAHGGALTPSLGSPLGSPPAVASPARARSPDRPAAAAQAAALTTAAAAAALRGGA